MFCDIVPRLLKPAIGYTGMSGKSPLDFDMRVSTSKKKTSASKKSGVNGKNLRQCQWEGCEEHGAYRAPKSPKNTEEFYWYCMDHVRKYNQSWNFYSGMSPEEAEKSRRDDNTWARPTWTMGKTAGPGNKTSHSHANGNAWARWGFEDPSEVLGENATINPGSHATKEAILARIVPKPERKALEILNLPLTTDIKTIRLRYRELIKMLHPDLNGGDTSEEERLREVLWAWDQLKDSQRYKK